MQVGVGCQSCSECPAESWLLRCRSSLSSSWLLPNGSRYGIIDSLHSPSDECHGPRFAAFVTRRVTATLLNRVSSGCRRWMKHLRAACRETGATTLAVAWLVVATSAT